jgi:branched-chain amino acid transport system ATP-binding protein
MPLEIADLDVGYGAKKVVDGATLRVAEREIVTVIGANGVGKTTLLKGLFGILRPSRGSIRWNGKEIAGRSPAANVRDGITYGPQGAPVYRSLTVGDNLVLAGAALRDRRLVRTNTARVLELFPILERRRTQRAGMLSGGERQMLSLAAALIPSPRLIMLDEPSGGLAPIVVESAFNTIRQVVDSFGTAVLLIEQNLQQSFAIADRAYVMAGGRIVTSGTPAELEQHSDFREHYFGGAPAPEPVPAVESPRPKERRKEISR